MFSIPQIITTLSLSSRNNSNSNSFHPKIDSSIKTWCIGLNSKARNTFLSYSSSFQTIPPPLPPSVKDGRKTTGNPPNSTTISLASSKDSQVLDRHCVIPIFSIKSRNSCLSSVISMASISTPIILMLFFSQYPS